MKKNQELLRLSGVHKRLVKFLCVFLDEWNTMLENFQNGQKLTPLMLIHKEIANVMLDFLLFFTIENESTTEEIETIDDKFMEILEKNIHFSAEAVYLLTHLCNGNEDVTNSISQKTIREIVTRLHPASWHIDDNLVSNISNKFHMLKDSIQGYIKRQ